MVLICVLKIVSNNVEHLFVYLLAICMSSLVKCLFIPLPIIFKIYFKWRLIALQYCIGFCHISVWINHRYTCVSSILNLPPAPLSCHRAPGWASCILKQISTGSLFCICSTHYLIWFVLSYMSSLYILYINFLVDLYFTDFLLFHRLSLHFFFFYCAFGVICKKPFIFPYVFF